MSALLAKLRIEYSNLVVFADIMSNPPVIAINNSIWGNSRIQSINCVLECSDNPPERSLAEILIISFSRTATRSYKSLGRNIRDCR